MLDVLLIEKTIQQLDLDLREMPERVPLTLRHLAQMLGDGDQAPVGSTTRAQIGPRIGFA